jgi:hypothetical protein
MLNDIQQFVVPERLLSRTFDVLREAGRSGNEAFVLWGGTKRVSDFLFIEAYVPRQEAIQSDEGLLVVVAGEALFEANRAFYETGLIMAAQVHSHPTSAFHSETDDGYPLITLEGGLSLVIPDFAAADLEQREGWALFRLMAGKWESAAVDLLEVVS